MRKNPFTMKGRIERCWLFTWRTPAAEAAAALPPPLVPVTRDGWAFWNVVVCRVAAMRPKPLPSFLGTGYWHVAYRLYARYRDVEGLAFLRSDCDSALMTVLGNVMTDFRFHAAGVAVEEDGPRVRISIDSPDAPANATLDRSGVAVLPGDSVFGSLEEASIFLKYKPAGLSVGADGRVNVVRIVRDEEAWRSRGVRVTASRWRFFDGKPVHPELAFEVDPIAYQWNRGEAC